MPTQSLHSTRRARFDLKALVLAVAALFIASDPAAAQGAATGAVTGRVFNADTREYVRNAEVRLEKGTQFTVTEDDGSFRLSNVPVGPAVLTVTYTGYSTIHERILVTSGVSAPIEINLTRATGKTEEVVKLAEYVVQSEREGNAKAIMEQKNSMNITNSIASDVFGDVAEGNAAEFLKNIPGVDLNLVQGEIVNVQLRGMGAEYNSVTVDGVRLGSADANKGAAGDARAFSFEQVSLNSMDSIEVSKTISADVDANAPAGTINMKTKRAFSRTGRRVTAQANVTAVDTQFRLGETYGPDDRKSWKLRPGAILEYSDIFLNRRLGVVLNISESNLYSENQRTIISYSYTTKSPDDRPVVPTSIQLYQSPRINRRSTVTFTSDFKATPNLILSLGLIYNGSQLCNVQRGITFAAANRAAVIGSDPLNTFTATGTVTVNPMMVDKYGETYTVLPKIEYKAGDLTLEGKFVGSMSTSWYNPMAHRGTARNAGSPQLAGVGIKADHLSSIGGDWQLVQTSGPDLSRGDGYTNRELTINDGRSATTKVYSGDVTGTWMSRRWLPITWKTGVKWQREERAFVDRSNAWIYLYTGPSAGTGVWANYPSPYAFGGRSTNSSLISSSGNSVFIPDLVALGDLFTSHPEYFTNRITNGSTPGARYQSAYVANSRKYQEDITAGFLMGTTSFGRATVRGGLRWEETQTDALEFDPRTPAEIRAAGYAVTPSTGVATTIEGVQYQYFSKPRVDRKGRYDNLFPSASFKYRFTPRLDFQFGYSSTIRRPTFRDVSGVWQVNETAMTVSVPNPNLKPERSDNYATRVAYYFEPVGIFAVNFFQNKVRNKSQLNYLTAAEFGYAGEEYSSYTFATTVASENEVRLRGMELEYAQSLSFLPKPFKGLGVRASYTRNYSDITIVNMSPHGVNAGLSYVYRRLSVSVGAIWRDNVPQNVSGTSYNRHRMPVDVGGSFKLNSQFTVFLTGRNIFDEPVITMVRQPGTPALTGTYEVTSAIWTFGIKGVF